MGKVYINTAVHRTATVGAHSTSLPQALPEAQSVKNPFATVHILEPTRAQNVCIKHARTISWWIRQDPRPGHVCTVDVTRGTRVGHHETQNHQIAAIIGSSSVKLNADKAQSIAQNSSLRTQRDLPKPMSTTDHDSCSYAFRKSPSHQIQWQQACSQCPGSRGPHFSRGGQSKRKGRGRCRGARRSQ